MAVDLNEPTLVKPYEMYEGRNTKRMPELIADGRTPASVADIMERRVNSQNGNWRSLYFDTGDLIAYHPNGSVKVVRDSPLLRELTPKTPLVNGALVLADGAYEALDGIEFKRKDAVFDRDLTLQDARTHPFWEAVARDKTLLATYVEAMFPAMKVDEAMGVYLTGTPEQPQARALFVYGLGSRSLLYGGGSLDVDFGRLVGLAPEAQSAKSFIVQPTLEQAVAMVNRDISKIGLRVSP